VSALCLRSGVPSGVYYLGMTVRNYRDLVAWQQGMQLVKSVYELSEDWPSKELYGLTSQVRRAAISVPSNIAEGHGRRTTKDYLRHLDIAYGSLMEVETQLQIAHALGYLPEQVLTQIQAASAELGRVLNGLISALERRLSSTES